MGTTLRLFCRVVFVVFAGSRLFAGSITLNHPGNASYIGCQSTLTWSNVRVENGAIKTDWLVSVRSLSAVGPNGAWYTVKVSFNGVDNWLVNSGQIAKDTVYRGTAGGTWVFPVNQTFPVPGVYKVSVGSVSDIESNFSIVGDLPYKFRCSVMNSTDWPKSYRLMQNNIEVGYFIVGAHSGTIAEFELDSPAPVYLLERAEGLQYDGTVWIVKGGAVMALNTNGPYEPVRGSPPTVGIPESPAPVLPPANGGTASGDTGTWSDKSGAGNGAAGAPQIDQLTNTTFREGVDKILQKIGTGGGGGDGDGLTNANFNEKMADLMEKEAIWREKILEEEMVPSVEQEEDPDPNRGKASAASVTGLGQKLPTMPVITVPTSQSSFSVNFAIPGIGTKTVVVDLTGYSVPIDIFRAIVTGCIAIAFFFMATKAIRDAFAG